MAYFTKLFFNSANNELNADYQEQLAHRLQSIYGMPVIYFNSLDDFDACKNQLIQLLNHIHNISPQKLGLFARYRDRVDELTSTQSSIDIRITLVAAKTSIENQLLSIERNYSRIDEEKLNSLIVELCYAGAFSNIELALGHFQLDTLAFFIDNIKSQLLLQIAQEFLLHYNLITHIGNEVHYAATLYNYVADQYGLSLREDPWVTQFSDNLIAQFNHYLAQKFTLSAFMRLFQCNIAMPPEEKITVHNNLFEPLSDFFSLFEKSENIATDYSQLYDSTEDKLDDFNPILIPKPAFSTRCACLLASYLQEKGYLKNIYFQALNKQYLYNGETSIGLTENGDYQLLSDKDLMCLIMEPLPNFIAFSLINQLLTLNDDLPVYLLKQCSALVYKHQAQLIDRLKLAEYVFNRNYPLPLDQLKFLAEVLSIEERMSFIKLAIQAYNVNYVESLLASHLASVEYQHQLIKLAVKLDAAGVFDLLYRLNFDFNSVDCDGKTLVHYIAIEGNIRFLEKSHDLDLDLSMPDNEGRTPLHYAAINGHAHFLEKFQECQIDLDTTDHKGLTALHYAACRGHINCLETLRELSVDLHSADFKGLTAVHYAARNGQVSFAKKLHEIGLNFTTQTIKGLTAAHYAVMNGHLEFFNMLREFDIPLDTPDHYGLTVAHYAAINDRYDFLPSFMQLNVALDACEKEGLTPAHYTAIHDSLNFFDELIKLNIAVDTADKAGLTLAHFAAASNNADFIVRLHELNIALDKPNQEGKTPAVLAGMYLNFEVLNQLKELGINIKYPLSFSQTHFFLNRRSVPDAERLDNSQECVIS